MAKKKTEQKAAAPEIYEYTTTAEPKAWADEIPVFCAHDAVVKTSEIKPNPRNPNQHPPEQIKLLGAIIKAQGWRGPITISNRSGMIVRGHGRLMAAQLEDLAEVPVDYQNYSSEAEEMADLIADNRIAELSDADNKMLAEVFADIDTGEIPFMLTGYTEDDYENIVNALSEALHEETAETGQEDELQDTSGELWLIGKIRASHGQAGKGNILQLADLISIASPDKLQDILKNPVPSGKVLIWNKLFDLEDVEGKPEEEILMMLKES